MSAIAASISTLATGFLFQAIGTAGGYIATMAVAAAATVLIAMFVTETKPADYEE